MKTNTAAKAIIISIVLTTSVVATSANAGSKLKPSTANVQVAWYQPVLSFFNFE